MSEGSGYSIRKIELNKDEGGPATIHVADVILKDVEGDNIIIEVDDETFYIEPDECKYALLNTEMMNWLLEIQEEVQKLNESAEEEE